MKTCTECKDEKSLSEFYAHPRGNLGRMHVCKNCHRARVTLRRKTNPRVQEYDRLRYQRPERQVQGRANSKRWRETYPEAYRAQTAVSNAVRDGRLKKGPCTICGASENVHGHHRDYNKPLEVIWLCAKCHHRIHAAFPELHGHGEARA
jgi:uncharacterized protein YlaI